MIKYNRKNHLIDQIERSFNELKKYEDGLEYLYENVDPESRELIVKIIAYQITRIFES